MPPSARTGAPMRPKASSREPETTDPITWKLRKLPYMYPHLEDALAALGELREACHKLETTPEQKLRPELNNLIARGYFAPKNSEARAKDEPPKDVSAEDYVRHCFSRRFFTTRRKKGGELVVTTETTKALARYLKLRCLSAE